MTVTPIKAYPLSSTTNTTPKIQRKSSSENCNNNLKRIAIEGSAGALIGLVFPLVSQQSENAKKVIKCAGQFSLATICIAEIERIIIDKIDNLFKKK